MLKFIGTDEDLKANGFEYQGGMWYFKQTNECPMMGDEVTHKLGVDIGRKQVSIPKIDFMRYNLFTEILDKLYDLIKDGLVIKEESKDEEGRHIGGFHAGSDCRSG